MKLILHKLTLDDVDISIHCEAEDIPVRGNLVDSGDAEQDKEMEDEVLDRLNDGDEWAWCSIEVRATHKGIYASEYLGGCSYVGERDFVKNSGYYEDMVQRAIEGLQSVLDAQAATVAALVTSIEV